MVLSYSSQHSHIYDVTNSAGHFHVMISLLAGTCRGTYCYVTIQHGHWEGRGIFVKQRYWSMGIEETRLPFDRQPTSLYRGLGLYHSYRRCNNINSFIYIGIDIIHYIALRRLYLKYVPHLLSFRAQTIHRHKPSHHAATIQCCPRIMHTWHHSAMM